MKFIKKKIYNILRNYLKKYFTNNLGKVVEDEENLICYVKKSKIMKKGINRFYGIKEVDKRLATFYKLNKKICYVIDGFNFDKEEKCFFGYGNADIEILNCKFNYGLHINTNGKCIIDNISMFIYPYSMLHANEFTIKNIDNNQITYMGDNAFLSFNSYNKIEIINSNLNNNDNNISFYADNEVNFNNSNIYGKQIRVKTMSINADTNSSLIASDEVILETDNFNPMKINATKITLNGENIVPSNSLNILRKVTEPLTLKRLELINTLKKVKEKCELINSNDILNYQEEINSRSISKILTK